MSRIGVANNIFQPNSQCLSCKYWKSAKKDTNFSFTIGGNCTAGYCKKNQIKSK